MKVMSEVYDYLWKNGPSVFFRRVRFNRELAKDSVFIDLRNGEAHRVFSVREATNLEQTDGDWVKYVVQTMPLKTISEEELSNIREKCNYSDSRDWEYCIPPLATTC